MRSVPAPRRFFHQDLPGLHGIRRVRTAKATVSPATHPSIISQKSMVSFQSMRRGPPGIEFAPGRTGQPAQLEALTQPLPPAPSPKRRGGEEDMALGLLPLSVSGRGLGGGVVLVLLKQERRYRSTPIHDPISRLPRRSARA